MGNQKSFPFGPHNTFAMSISNPGKHPKLVRPPTLTHTSLLIPVFQALDQGQWETNKDQARQAWLTTLWHTKGI